MNIGYFIEECDYSRYLENCSLLKPRGCHAGEQNKKKKQFEDGTFKYYLFNSRGKIKNGSLLKQRGCYTGAQT